MLNRHVPSRLGAAVADLGDVLAELGRAGDLRGPGACPCCHQARITWTQPCTGPEHHRQAQWAGVARAVAILAAWDRADEISLAELGDGIPPQVLTWALGIITSALLRGLGHEAAEQALRKIGGAAAEQSLGWDSTWPLRSA
jgi:hypothetical protein